MGWFWGSKSPDRAGDPYEKLDPALREFLDKESPLKYEDTRPKARALHESTPTTTATSTPKTPTTNYRSQLGLDSEQRNSPPPNASHAASVPPESLFQDGRYAHLWKDYRPQSEIEASGQTDQDRLADVISAYHDRKAAIGRAAVENCILEQMAEKECLTSGSWAKLMTMCREENRAFNRCYTMQSRFLKALGYLSASQRSGEEEERIQMHADKLYHEMLEREKVQEEAKKEGKDVPVFEPLIQPERTTQALGEDSAWAQAREKAKAGAKSGSLPTALSEFPLQKQQEIRERIKGLSDGEKELELQLLAAESRAQIEYAERIQERIDEEKLHRAERRERGKETIGDTIKRLWGWDR